ncbi:MAG: hypothetical protein GY749_06460 [Desulfobacteraceae bacterium]|nr:hypothetical protein [Desulfobacteraceae bacterium]
MTAETAEEQFADEMHRTIEEFGRILRPCFRRMPDEDIEMDSWLKSKNPRMIF